ncbi:ATP-grasp domain-containing protein [Halorussus salinus]|uniref:ATP-grasp domain-containing protein n=1 Tax=Halorussus salinus TaxID=1364935 RepID=UPI00138F3131|nr:ATP-grasp domain-containing protein [Halorussus salinus]
MVLCDASDFPGGAISVSPGGETTVLGSSFAYDDVEGAYFHSQALFRPEYRLHEVEDDPVATLNRWQDHRSLFKSLCRSFESRGIDVLPRLHNHYMQEMKPWQLERCANRGVPVPDTIFTNSPEEVRRFYERHDRVVYKPVSHGAPPNELTDDDLTDQRLEKLATAPVQLQEFVRGDDLRLYVLDGDVVGATRYVSENFSFKLDQRESKAVDLEPATVSEEVESAAIRAAEAVELQFGAVDVRRSDSEYAVLEVNQSPALAAADIRADQTVGDAVAEYLLDSEGGV